MPRVKKQVTAGKEQAVEQVVEEPIVEEGSDDSVIERVVNKLQKVVTIKKQLSEKQQAHLDSLANKRKGKKFVMAAEPADIKEIPVKVTKPKSAQPKKEVKPKKTPSIQPTQTTVFISRFKKSLF